MKNYTLIKWRVEKGEFTFFRHDGCIRSDVQDYWNSFYEKNWEWHSIELTVIC